MIKRILTATCVLLMTFANAQTNTGSKIKKDEAQSALEFHNKVRNDVGVSALTWSNELSTYAQAWAENLVSTGCKLKHRPANGQWAQKYGENIFYASKATANALNASEAWYSEIKDFKYGPLNTNNWAKTGHYTQMVWRTTTRVGIAKAKCPSGATIIVANYSPIGNYMGQKPY